MRSGAAITMIPLDVGRKALFAPTEKQFTGQKIPPMTGTIAEIQQGINHLVSNFQVVLNNQKTMVDNQIKISSRLANLENGANQKLVNLTEQVKRISNVKLTHERETRQIEYNQKPTNLLENKQLTEYQ